MLIKDLKEVINNLDENLEVYLCWEEWFTPKDGTSISFFKSENIKSAHLILLKENPKRIILSTTGYNDIEKPEKTETLYDN